MQPKMKKPIYLVIKVLVIIFPLNLLQFIFVKIKIANFINYGNQIEIQHH